MINKVTDIRKFIINLSKAEIESEPKKIYQIRYPGKYTRKIIEAIIHNGSDQIASCGNNIKNSSTHITICVVSTESSL